MLVHVAENGKSFELDCQPVTPVEVVQTWLTSLTHVPAHDQLLICGDTRLEANRPLGYYNLPAEGCHVFLFNRGRLMADSPAPPYEQLEAIEPLIPQPPGGASYGSHPLDKASDPALKALPSYETQFKYHFQKGHAIYTASQARFEACRRLFREQQIQSMALETARGNMDHYYKMIGQMYGEFLKHFNRQHKQHTDLLTNFERDLERLRAWKLHPALVSEARKNLLDFVDASPGKWVDSCAVSHRQFQGKVLQLKNMYMELQHNVEELFYTAPSVDVHREVKEMITDHERYIEEEASIMQSLSKDVNTVRKLVDDCVSSQLSASLRPHDAVSALGPMYDVHDKNHLPRMEACCQKMGKLLEHCRIKKHEMTLCVHTCMQKVAALQSSIRDMRNQLSAFKEAMARQDENFSVFKKVRKIGAAYKACLLEVVRRKAGMKLYMGQAGQLAEKLARKREAEVARREEFIRVQSLYIPRDILGAMGLFGVPSQCVVNIEPYDTNLLDIDMADLERYAPESLAGPVLKGFGLDHSLQGRSSISGSGGIIHSGTTGEEHLLTGDFDAETNEEDGNSDEIVGTSKLEVENAWLKAELASAMALLCNLDPNLEHGIAEADDSNLESSRRNAAQRTAEALGLKDEHAKHLQNMLKMRQLQCISYEKRIRELEQRLSDQYMELQKLSSAGTASQHLLEPGTPTSKGEEILSKSEASGVTGEARTLNILDVSEPMDEGVSSSGGMELREPSLSEDGNRHTDSSEHIDRLQEGGDETMSDLAGGVSSRDTFVETDGGGLPGVVEKGTECGSGLLASQHANLEVQQPLKVTNVLSQEGTSAPFGEVGKIGVPADKETVALLKEREEQLSALQETLLHKTRQCAGVEEKLKAALEDLACLRTELEGNAELLSECQMNCAHLENRLHEAREEARTNLCAADRRAAEYNALRTSSVKLRGLVERLRHCILAPQAGTTGFAESLRALAVSLGSNDNVDNGSGEFRACLRVLAERVGWLAQQRAELLERCTVAEATQTHQTKELESKTELLKSLYEKRKIDKQANKEKICFTRFEVHELAVFLPNASGHYEAINRNCPNYFLSDESIALFLEHPPSGQQYIIGQIVHIDRNVARLPPQSSPQPGCGRDLSGSNAAVAGGSRSRFNPYGLPVGTEYFVVTVAMVPDFIMPSKVA